MTQPGGPTTSAAANDEPAVAWSSDRTLRVGWPDNPGVDRLIAAADALREADLPGVVDVVPAARSVTLTVDLAFVTDRAAADSLSASVHATLRTSRPRDTPAATAPREVTIPVRYGGADGPDLGDVASLHGISPDDVVRAHTAGVYRVRFLGFAPGFAYLDGLVESIRTPRLDTPRTRVPAGSVGIAGAHTGVYPHEMPGGWRIIGRTTLAMFDPERDAPSLLAPGDIVRFVVDESGNRQ